MNIRNFLVFVKVIQRDVGIFGGERCSIVLRWRISRKNERGSLAIEASQLVSVCMVAKLISDTIEFDAILLD